MSEQGQTDDLSLLESAQAGDEGAASLLVQRYADAVFGYAYRRLGNREDAEEVANDALLALIGSPFPKAMPRTQSAFRAWLFGIARRRVADRWRAWYREYDRFGDPNDADAEEAEPRLDAGIEDQEGELWVESVLRTLPPRERDAVSLRLAGLAPKEIASVLDVSPANAYVTLSRAMRRLRNRLVELGEFPQGSGHARRADADQEP